MKRNARIFIALTAALVCLTSCMEKYRQIGITSFDVESVSPTGMKSAEARVKVGVHNPAGTVQLRDINGVLRHDSTTLVILRATDVRLAPRCDSTYTLWVTGNLAEGVSLLNVVPLLHANGLEAVTADLSARATLKNGLGKDIAFKDIPLKDMNRK